MPRHGGLNARAAAALVAQRAADGASGTEDHGHREPAEDLRRLVGRRFLLHSGTQLRLRSELGSLRDVGPHHSADAGGTPSRRHFPGRSVLSGPGWAAVARQSAAQPQAGSRPRRPFPSPTARVFLSGAQVLALPHERPSVAIYAPQTAKLSIHTPLAAGMDVLERTQG